MPITPASPFPKSPGDPIQSADWNQTVDEVIGLDNRKVNRSGDAIAGSLTINGNLGVGTASPQARAHINGAVRIDGAGGTLLHHSSEPTGAPARDGARIRYEPNFFGTSQDALVIEKTDGNAATVEGGIVFANVGNTGGRSTALAIRGDGNVGVGTTAPDARLHVNGAVRIDGTNDTAGTALLVHNTSASGTPTGDGIRLRYEGSFFGSSLDALVIEKTDANDTTVDGGIAFTNVNTAGTRTTALVIRGNNNVGIGTLAPEVPLEINAPVSTGSSGGGLLVRTSTQQLRFDGNEVNCNGTLFLNFWSVEEVRTGPLRVVGNLTVTGSKSGYVTDRFQNKSGGDLEQGDVVVLGRSVVASYGRDDNIPVPEVDRCSKAGDTNVCGIVYEVVVESAEDAQNIEAKLAAANPAPAPASKKKGGAAKAEEVKQRQRYMQLFTRKQLETLDVKKVTRDQYGEMVTHGCFAHCKAVGPIDVGDLLTTSAVPGHAQRSQHGASPWPHGAILGKALAPLAKGAKGKIPVLVTLQ